MTLVSLVMPVWQPHPIWFPDAVSSALDETVDVELILVDDGNDTPVDSPVDDPRVRVLRSPHRGPYAARDVGLAHAKGTHVRYVDADDMVVAGSTTALVEAAEGREVIVHGVTEICDDALQRTGVAGSELIGSAADACLLGRFDVFHVSLLYPRSVIDRVGAWEVPGFRVSGDWDYVLRALELAPVVPLGSVVTKYRRHADSVMSRARVVEGGRARELVLRRHFERHPGRRGTPIEREAYAAMYLEQAAAHAWRGERRDAAVALLRGARRRPLAASRVAAELLVERARLSRAATP